MLKKLNSLRNREDGFTLIELLIVVIIIGILAAIALPIFLNQQKAAADARVQSDVRNTVDNVQTWLVSNQGLSASGTGSQAGATATAAWTWTPAASAPATNPVVVDSSNDVINVGISTQGGFQVSGYSTSGNQYSSTSKTYLYDSTKGTFVTGAAVAAVPATI